MINITLLAVGPLKNKALQALAQDYTTRISPYARLHLVEIAAASFGKKDKKQAKNSEKEALEKVLHRYEKEEIFLLAEKGRLFDSLAFADFLEERDGANLVLVIGGALGWPTEFLEKYQAISLSALTFPHELARVILLEQLYRGLLIKAGKEYHY